MDIKRYVELKEIGNAKVEAVAGIEKPVLMFKVFDQLTGNSLPDGHIHVDSKPIAARIAELELELESAKVLHADIVSAEGKLRLMV